MWPARRTRTTFAASAPSPRPTPPAGPTGCASSPEALLAKPSTPPSGSGVVADLVELTGDPQKVVSIADLDAPSFGVRFSGTAGSVPAALAEAAALIEQGKLHIPVDKSYTLAEAAQDHIDSHAGHTRGRRVMIP